MKKKWCYIVVNEGAVVYASYNGGKAERYANDKWEEAVQEAVEEFGYDEDMSPTERNKAEYQAGYDSGTYEVHKISLEGNIEDEIELNEGGTVSMEEVLDKLSECE